MMNNSIVSKNKVLFVFFLISSIGTGSYCAHAQSIFTCDTTWVSDSNGNNQLEQTNCVDEWSSQNGPQITVSSEIDNLGSPTVTAVGATVQLYGPNGYIASSSDNPAPYQPNNDDYASVTSAISPQTTYTARGSFNDCTDSSGNGGYGPDGSTWSCGNTSSGTSPTDLGTALFSPSAEVLSILYAPPGDKSTTGFTSSTTNGTTSTVGSSFTQSYGIAFSGQGTVFGLQAGGSLGFSRSSQSGESTTFQTTLTDATGVTEIANTLPQYNPNKLDMPSRLWDSFSILLNPQITTASDDSGNIVGYAADIQPVAGDGWTIQPAISEVVASDMIGGTVPADTLNQLPLPLLPNQPQYYLPGLASVCKNVIASEYNSSSCTTNDQCGCGKSDFSAFLQQDALLNWNPSSLSASPTPAYVSPVSVDTSGSSCLNPNSSASCRYVPVPQSSGSSTPQAVQLNSSVANSYTQTDSTSTTSALNEQTSYQVALTSYIGWSIQAFGVGGGGRLTQSDTWTWTNSESKGSINGNQNAMMVNLQTDNSGCVENNYVYEDTVYHTFVVQPPQNVPNCK